MKDTRITFDPLENELREEMKSWPKQTLDIGEGVSGRIYGPTIVFEKDMKPKKKSKKSC